MSQLIDRLRHKINPQYVNVIGTESHLYNECANELERLHQVCRDAYEVWAGSEGIPEPKYASEAYLLSLLMKMTDEVRKIGKQ